jgi:hypothetical protein
MEPEMLSTTSSAQFHRARWRAFIRSVVRQLRGTAAELLAFEEIRRRLRLGRAHELGLQQIELDKIIGSVGRYRDFDREFLPLHRDQEQRWRRVYDLNNAFAGLPPIEVFKVSDVYFVRDGNHRVSVARANGLKTIEAQVTEYAAPIPLGPQDTMDAVLIRGEAAHFFEVTQLDRIRPEQDVRFTNPGRYGLLLEHIHVHRYLREVEQSREIPYSEAVASWYDHVYLPLVLEIRERGILKHFPGRTEADLYAWLVLHRAELEAHYGFGEVDDVEVVDELEKLASRSLLEKVRHSLLGARREPAEPRKLP